MKNLAYKVLFSEGAPIEGMAQSLSIRDSIGVLTLKVGSAPLISLLKHGAVEILNEDGKVTTHSYQEGLLRLTQTDCTVTLLY